MSTTHPQAVLFGAIGTLAETSEIQRGAFNAAFEEAGLGWKWDIEAYFDMLTNPGGQARIAAYAEARGENVDAEAVHASKVRHFRRMAQLHGFLPRPGVVELIRGAKARGTRVGFVTTTGPDTVDLIFEGLSGALGREDFDLITDRLDVARGKPDPAIYHHALEMLGIGSGDALAIEDTPESARAAVEAGIPTLGFPGLAARGRAFPGTIGTVDTLGPEILSSDLARVA